MVRALAGTQPGVIAQLCCEYCCGYRYYHHRLDCSARDLNTVNRLMRARHIDATVADFLSALVRYGVIAFTLIAALGRVGFKPPRLLPYWAPLV